MRLVVLVVELLAVEVAGLIDLSQASIVHACTQINTYCRYTHIQKHLHVPDAGHGCQNELMGTTGTTSNLILKHCDVCLKLDTVVSDKQDAASAKTA